MMKKYEKIPCPHCGKLVAYDNTFGKKYHFDNCKSKPIEGFGDVVKKITNFLGIETCDACEERRKKLNDLFPYTKSKKLNNEQIEFIKRIRSIREISSEDWKKRSN